MSEELDFDRDGAERHRAALGEEALLDLERVLATVLPDMAGTRLYGIPGLAERLVSAAAIGGIAAKRLGDRARPVRAILFDKRADANWSLSWHQDRTIAVRQRIETPGYGPWTVKSGLLHVAPPFAIVERMMTLRVHLDPVTPDNAPLLIAPGSHRLGRIAEAEIGVVVAQCGRAVCLADRGDVWAYATPILHASDASKSGASRRVLQIDYSAAELDGELEWLGLG